MPVIFQPQIAKIINKALSVRVIVICSGHKLLWRDSYKSVGHASTLPKSITHKIIIIINLSIAHLGYIFIFQMILFLKFKTLKEILTDFWTFMSSFWVLISKDLRQLNALFIEKIGFFYYKLQVFLFLGAKKQSDFFILITLQWLKVASWYQKIAILKLPFIDQWINYHGFDRQPLDLLDN